MAYTITHYIETVKVKTQMVNSEGLFKLALEHYKSLNTPYYEVSATEREIRCIVKLPCSYSEEEISEMVRDGKVKILAGAPIG